MEHYAAAHFRPEEFLPPETWERWGVRGLLYFVDVRVQVTADTIRGFFGAPVTGNNWVFGGKYRYRGYRPASYYTDKGVPLANVGSQHLFGRAFDCTIKGVTATEARDTIMNHQHIFPYIRRMEDNVGWLHFDVANDHHHGIHLFQP